MTPREVTQLRERLNMTRTEFAALIGTTRQTILRWESGVHPVSKPWVYRLQQKALDTPRSVA